MDLFEHNYEKGMSFAPLAARIRPQRLQDMIGQPNLLGPGAFLRRAVEKKFLPSIILWGPPGTGKTTLAEVLGRELEMNFVSLSAVTSGVKDLKVELLAAQRNLAENSKKTLLFIDEIHRFNKSQQDALLPAVEKGIVTLIGATTENPSFEVNSALLSRCRVLVLTLLNKEELHSLSLRAFQHPKSGFAKELTLSSEALEALIQLSAGDARRFLTNLEVSVELMQSDQQILELSDVQRAVQHSGGQYDKSGEQHYDYASAFIKSMRGSDVDASLYYLMRMLEGGEDPKFIVRRMIIFASEDIGNADPRALHLATDAMHTVHFVGMPECIYTFVQVVSYLALAPKSNATVLAITSLRADLKKYPTAQVPMHLRNARSKLMENIGYGKDYKYAHNHEEGVAKQEYLPIECRKSEYYQPKDSGYEIKLKERMSGLKKLLK